MKKGFTLIEIIISIVLILIIGTSATVFVVNNKSDNELENITKKILEAANLYASKEVDENGNVLINEVRKDKKGVQIPVNNLVNKGYVNEEDVNRVKELTNDENYYIMLLEGTPEGYDYCGDGKIFSLASWTYNGNDVYLCDNEYNNNNTNNLYNKIKNMDYYTQCDKTTSSGLCFLKAHEGLVDENTDGTLSDVYYFRGNAENNYLKFNGLDKMFRIVRTTENNGVKIVADNAINSLVWEKAETINHFHVDVSGNASSSGLENNLYIEMDGFKIKNFNFHIKEFDYRNYECPDSGNTSSFSDNRIVTCTDASSGKSVEIQSPLYTTIYRPLYNNYQGISSFLNNYIDNEYKWCLSSTENSHAISHASFKCNEEKTFLSEVGLLNIFEYNAIQFIKKIDSNTFEQSIYGKPLGGSIISYDIEISFGTTPIHTTFKLNPYIHGSSIGFIQRKLRPTYVIKGNSKIVDGDGTVDNPFIIDGFIN